MNLNRKPVLIASEPVDLEFDSGSGHTKDFRKLVFTASCLALSIKNKVKTKLTNLLVVSLKNALIRESI